MSHKNSQSSSGTSHGDCLNTDNKCNLDDECGKMQVWCWPTGPKNFLGPCKYDRKNFWRIPTGSLYFASRKGPLSEMNARVTGSPYDLVGIIFQSKAEGEEGTYVYTVDSTFVLDSQLTNRVVALKLDKLVTDNSIIYHAILPLKDFDDGGVQPDNFPKTRGIGDDHGKHEPVAYEAVERWARKFDESCSSSSKSHHRPLYHSRKGDEEKGWKIHHSKYDSSSSDSDCESSSDSSDCSSSSSSSSSSLSYTCAPSSGGCGSYSDSECMDIKSWRNRLRDTRNQVLKDLFKKYYDSKPEHDAYQVLASIVGLPVAENLRSKNSYTAPELVGLILFQAGLIWDDHFATCNRNPVCCFDKCFFQRIVEKTNKDCNEVEAVITLTTPKAYADSKYSDTRLSKTDTKASSDYPSACYESEESEYESESSYRKKSYKSYKKSSVTVSKKKKDETDSTDESDKEGEDVKLRKNLQKHLNESLKKGAEEAGKPTEDKEKGCYDYYGCDDESSYKRASYPAKWYGSDDCYRGCKNSSDSSGPWPKPCCKTVHARTIFFGSLRPVDFLIDYYRATGIDPNGHINLDQAKCLTGRNGQAGELVAIIHSLAAQRSRGDLLDYDINKINVSWYHDSLVPVELCNDSEDDCCDQIERECKYMRDLVCQIDRTFTQKRMLNVDNAGFSGSLLLKVCRRTSELAADLHCLASELDTYVVRCGSGSWRHIGDCEDNSQYSGPEECRFKLRVDSCSDRCATDYLIVLNKYMWASGWEFHWKKPLCCSSSKYYHLVCRTKRLIADLLDLKNRTPVTCIILELIVNILEQTNRLYKYLAKSRKHCCGSSSSSSSSSSSYYRHHKGGEVDVAGLIEEAFPEKVKE